MSDNLPEVEAALQRWRSRVDDATNSAVSLIGRQILIFAKENADTGKNPPVRINGRLRYNPHIPGTGPGPNRGTGNLLTSITLSTRRQGFGTYTAEVGAGAIYARQLELGGGKWPSGVKYPYMEPALNKLVSGGKLSQILAYSYRSLGG